MLQKGSLPTVGQIEFDLDEARLNMLEKRLINELPLTATISFPDNPKETKKIIRIILELAASPGSHESISKSISAGSNLLSKSTATGLARAGDYMMDKIISKNSWLLFGKIAGENPTPIIILFCIRFNLGTFSFKKKEESAKEFNPQLN